MMVQRSKRLACVAIPALPLQLLMRQHPEWSDKPAVVITEDSPTGRVLWVNSYAYQNKVVPGLRYVSALSLTPDLRAGTISQELVAAQVDELCRQLGCFSPDVEPYREVPGYFWLNAAGLGLIYASPALWAQKIRSDLQKASLSSFVVVGYTRLGTYAIATSRNAVFGSPKQEKEAMGQVELARLDILPAVRDSLAKLGITTIKDLLGLPSKGLQNRFGPQLHQLYRLAAGEDEPPLSPQRIQLPPSQQLYLDYPEKNATRLLFYAKRLLHPVLQEAANRSCAISCLQLMLVLQGHGAINDAIDEQVRPAVATLDSTVLLDLLRLKLSRLVIDAGVIELHLTAQITLASKEQLRFFAEQPRRDFAAADRALARIRSEFGERSVVHAQLRPAHLPEASFIWEPMHSLPQRATPHPASQRPLVRRLYSRPLALPQQLRRAPEGWLLRKFEYGSVQRLLGPYIVSGGWWAKEVHREYHFAEMQKGQLLWIYNDKRRRMWFVHGEVL